MSEPTNIVTGPIAGESKRAVAPSTSRRAPMSSTAGQPVAAGSSDAIRVISRALHGRYRMTLAAVMLAGVVGAAAAWLWTGPLYRSEGMVRIASATPAVIQPTDQNGPIPMFESYMQAQQELVGSQLVLEKAVQDPIWNNQPVRARRPSVDTMADNLKVEVRPRSENVRITYTDPRAEVATAAVESIISAYQKIFDESDQQLEQHRLQLLENYRDKLVSQLDLGKGAAISNSPASSSVPTTAPVVQTPEMPETLSPERLAMNDPVLRGLLDLRDQAKDRLDQATLDYGPNHPNVLHLTLAYQQASEKVEHYLVNYAALHAERETAGASGGVVTPDGVAPAPLSASMQQTQSEIDEVNQRIDVLKTEAAMPKRFEVVSTGTLPVAVPGRQLKATAISGGICAGVMAAIMVLAGLYRRRFNVCSDVVEALGENIPFVAAVPNVDAAGKSPRWADAARCMHCVRQKLDQNGKAYLITSADWSDGRTSTVMSLALSLSASGARTVVVDADLVTRGLTHALGLEDCSGFLEMLGEGQVPALLSMPRDSVAVVPSGAANESDGLSISGPAVARLLKRLKASYDVVLIDAGPALGRVETSVLVPEVDGVLLTIRRGEEQALVAKTLDELKQSGAKVIGAVFNRADPKDFDRSIQRRTSAHANWQPRTVAEPLANFGPLVQAVAMSLKHDVHLFPITGEASLGNLKGAA